MWWRDAQETRELLEHVQAHYAPLDAETLQRLHRYGERERLGLPLPWALRLRAFILDPLRRLLSF